MNSFSQIATHGVRLIPRSAGLSVALIAAMAFGQTTTPPVIRSIQSKSTSENELVLELTAAGLGPDFKLLGAAQRDASEKPSARRPFRAELMTVVRRDGQDVVVLRVPTKKDQARTIRLTLVNGAGASSDEVVVHCQGSRLTKLERVRSEPAAASPSGKSGSSHSPPSTTTAKPPPKPARSVPDQVVNACTPDLVRVPDAMGPAEKGIRMLQAQALKADSGGKIVATDRVVGMEPVAGNWVPPGHAIALTVERKVPLLRGDVKTAREQLRAQEFRETVPQGFREDDVVVDQKPAPGTYVPRRTRIALGLQRRVPAVEGRSVEIATKMLNERGFAIRHYPEWKSRDSVHSQQPKANELAPLGASIDLTLARRVPLVERQAVGAAARELEAWGWKHKIDVEGWDGRDSAFVAEQTPKARHEILLAPDSRDRNQLLVSLTPGSKVPQLAGEDLQAAQRLLRELRLLPRLDAGIDERWPSRVVRHTYRVGEIVPFGTAVDLQVRLVTVRIPLIIGKPIRVAADMLVEAGLRPFVGFDTFEEVDFVKTAAMRPNSSNPRVESGFALPGSEVQLTIARRIPAVEGMEARAAIEALGNIKLPWTTVGEGNFVARQEPRQPVLDPTNGEVQLLLGNPVPRVMGLNVEAAMAALNDNGFRGVVVRHDRVATPDPRLFGQTVAADQAIAPGTILPVGATVRLILVTYVPNDVPGGAMTGPPIDRPRGHGGGGGIF